MENGAQMRSVKSCSEILSLGGGEILLNMLGFIPPIVHLIVTKPLGGVIFPVAGKATDGGLEREILQPWKSSMQRQR